MAKKTKYVFLDRINELMDSIGNNNKKMYIFGTEEQRHDIFDKHIKPKLLETMADFLPDDQKDVFFNATDDEQIKMFEDYINYWGDKKPVELVGLALQADAHEIRKIFQHESAKKQLLDEFNNRKLDELENIFSIPTEKFTGDQYALIKSNFNPPHTIVIPNKQDMPNLGNVIVIGDVDCVKYKLPKSPDGIDKLFKTLPHAIIGKLNVSSWDKELFGNIKTLPYAETIDCSHSINSLNDLNDKLPGVLKTLIIQDTLIKPSALTKDATKRSAAMDFIATHPNLRIVSTNKNGDITFDLQESLAEIDKSKEAQTPDKNKRMISTLAAQKTAVTKVPDEYISINGFVDKYLVNNPEISINDKKTLRNIVKQVADIKSVSGIETKYVIESDYENITNAVIANITESQNGTDEEQKSNEQNSETQPKHHITKPNNVPVVQSRASNKILKFISNSDMDVLSTNTDKEELKESINKFNIWNQKNINNRSCTFIDTDGAEKPLPNMICRNNNTYSYDGTGGRARIDFKSTTLKDTNGNNILDDNGNEIYILVSVGSVSDHKRGNSDKRTKKHNDIIRNLDIYVTDVPLTDTQIKTIKNNKKSGRDVRFFTLPELQGLTQKYIAYTYTPQDQDEQKQTRTPQKPIVTIEPIIDRDAVKEDSTNAFQAVAFAQPKAEYIKPETHVAPKPAPHVDTPKKKPVSHDTGIAPITKQPYAQPISNVGGVFGLKMLEAQIAAQIELLKTLKENQEIQKREIDKMSEQMQEKIKTGDFASVGKLATQAETKKQKLNESQEKVAQAEQALKTMKDKFDIGQKLIEKRQQALTEKQAAEQTLHEKEKSLQDADDAVIKFLHELGKDDK